MQELSARFFAGEEGQEGMRAFAEKRRPAWAQEP
jgi:methylglutaconyl-CoA hydratase